MTVKEAVKKINNGKFFSLWESVEEVLDDIEPIVKELNLDHHRWYTVATNVYKLDDGFIGITGVIDLRGDMDFSDCSYETIAEEYEEFTTISYRPKE